MMNDLPLAEVYQLLEPGPVVLLTTAAKGRANVMTLSWHMMVEFEPPLVACVVSAGDYSFGALRGTKACVIAIPAVEMGSKVVAVGNCSGRDVVKAWVDPAQKDPNIIHHHGYGRFAVDGEMITLKSEMR